MKNEILKCLTVQPGKPCSFMTPTGCNFYCSPVIEKCTGCKNVNGLYCSIYPTPNSKWSVGGCGFATHIEKSVDVVKLLNPIKASKKLKKKKKVV